MKKVLAVACILVGVLFGFLSMFLAVFSTFALDYDGERVPAWVLVALLVSSIISFVVARKLWRIDEE